MNRLSVNCVGGRKAHKEKISVAQARVFGQKVGIEISCSRLSEGEQRKVREEVLESYDCQARMFRFYPSVCLIDMEANRMLRKRLEDSAE